MRSVKNYLFTFAAALILATGFTPGTKAGPVGINADSSRWEEVKGLPAARRSMATDVLNDALYAVGGHDDANEVTNAYRYNGTNWTEAARLARQAMWTGGGRVEWRALCRRRI